MSGMAAPWLMSGWMSLLANTPQRDAMVYVFSACCAASFISSGVILSSVAIWSMNAPVPPAQLPFMRTSVPPVRKRIFASSPPSSMMTSASGEKRDAATRVANTSCTNGTPHASARPMPAEPEMARYACCPWATSSSICASSSRAFSTMCE